MADTKFTVSQRADQSGANLLDQRPALKIVQIHFHQPYYKGKTPRLFPHPSNTDAIRWLEKELFPKGDADKDGGSDALHFVCSPVKPHAEKAGLWVSVVNATEVPAGLYILEVPFLRKVPGGGSEEKTFCQMVLIRAKLIAAGPDGVPFGPDSRTAPVVCEWFPGDGVSLEESLYNLFAYLYEESIGVLLAEDMKKVAEGGEPESGFKTFLGVADTLKEGAAGLIGLVKLDFGWYKTIKSVDSYLDGKGSRTVLALWKKSGLGKSALKWSNDMIKPNAIGMVIDADGKYVKRVNIYRKLDYVLGKHSKPVDDFLEKRHDQAMGLNVSEVGEIAGSIVDLLGNTVEAYEVMDAFVKADSARMDFMRNLTRMVDRRTQEMGWEIGYAKAGSAERKKMRDRGDAPPWERHGFFVRGDLTALEALKMKTDHAAGEAHLAAAKFTLKMSASAYGISGLGAIVGEKAEKAYEAVKKIASFVDSNLGSKDIDRWVKELETIWHDEMAYASNNNEILHRFIGMHPPYTERQTIAIQFLMRAKVLYGLKRLIAMCGPAVDKDRYDSVIAMKAYMKDKNDWLIRAGNFHRNVDVLGIKEYIRDFCLADRFWVRKSHAHHDWIHHFVQVDHGDAEYRDEVLRMKDPGDDKEWFEVDFQRYWPIHFMDIENVHKFCERFSNDWSPLKSKDVERCYLQRGEAKWSPIPGTGDRALEITRWVDLQDGEMIDSETPVRAVLIFTGTAKISKGVPVRFQVERTDGFNVPGPAYNTVARPCSKEDGEAIGVEKGRYVAILDFTYSYRKKQAKNFPEETAKIYHGIKPMVESIAWADVVKTTELAKFSADWVYHKIRPQEMTMAVRYAVGDGNVAGYAEKKGKVFSTTTEIRMVPDAIASHNVAEKEMFHERNDTKFGDRDFLERMCAEAPPPKMKLPEIEKAIVQYLRGETWRNLAKDTVIRYTDALRVIVFVDDILDGVPLTVRFERTDQGVDGPFYTSTVIEPLRKYGFTGKLGYVICPYYHYATWNEDLKVGKLSFHNDGNPIFAVKPVCKVNNSSEWINNSGSRYPTYWKGYTFKVQFNLGTNNPNPGILGWGWKSIGPDGICTIPHDIQFDMEESTYTSEARDFVAEGILGVHSNDIFESKRLCTTRLVIEKKGNIERTKMLDRFFSYPNYADMTTYSY